MNGAREAMWTGSWPVPYAINYITWPGSEQRVSVRDAETGEERWVAYDKWIELTDTLYLGQAARWVLRCGQRTMSEAAV